MPLLLTDMARSLSELYPGVNLDETQQIEGPDPSYASTGSQRPSAAPALR
jgi:hypothetical protein